MDGKKQDCSKAQIKEGRKGAEMEKQLKKDQPRPTVPFQVFYSAIMSTDLREDIITYTPQYSLSKKKPFPLHSQEAVAKSEHSISEYRTGNSEDASWLFYLFIY